VGRFRDRIGEKILQTLQALTFWTDTDPDTFRDVVVDGLAGLAPKVPVRRVSYEEGAIVFPDPGEVVVAMGSNVLKDLQKIGAVAKNRSLNSMRETAIPYKVMGQDPASETPKPSLLGVGHWMFSFSPNSIYVEADKRSIVTWDARLAHRFSTTGSLEPEIGTYAWTDTFEYVIQYVEEKFEETGRAVSVALDLETMGLVPWYDDKEIVSISLTVAPGVADAVYMLDPVFKAQPAKLQKLLTQLRWVVTSPKVALCGANLKYDIQWLWVKYGIRPTNFKMDTLLVGSLLNENRSNSLKQHAREHTAMGGYELGLDRWMKAHKLDKGQMEKIPKDVALPYVGGDTDVTYRVAVHQRKELQMDKRLQRFYVKLLHPAVRAFEAIEHRGMVVDLKEYGRLEKELVGRIAELEKEAIGMMPARLRAKHVDKLDLRAAVLKDFFFSDLGLGLKPKMYTEKKGDIKTDKAHFMMFEDEPEAKAFLDIYKQYTSATKTLSTYVHGFLNHLRPDGRFHPTYMLFNGSAFEGKDDDGGTDTGRTSAIDPAVQTIPKHTIWAKKLRKCFPAPPGYRFFQADFSQGELRLAACAAEEPNMIEAYRSGQDLHCVTGASLAGYDLPEFMDLNLPDGVKYEQASSAQKIAYELFAKFRQRAKPANFGLLYGMQSEGFREYARVNYGVNMSSAEAWDVREAFFALYAGLVTWHNDSIQFANSHGWIDNPLGRIAHLPLIKSKIWAVKSKAERKAINSPIQSTLSDLCTWAISILEERYGDEGLWMAGMTHDSIYGYYPEGNPQLWLGRIVEVMETLPYESVFDWHPVLNFPADVEEGPNLAELDKFKLAA
jgi:DNA polymerase I-like protein with 3'-5' exonuclease and polymerase domains